MMAVDILPTTIPLDASRHFSSKLEPYLWALINQMRGKSVEGEEAKYAEALDRATIAQGGRLTKQHEWLYNKVKKVQPATPELSVAEDIHFVPSAAASPDPPAESVSKVVRTRHPRKKILLFGSGMVAKPFVQTIWKERDASLELVVASNNIVEADSLVVGREAMASVAEIDVSNDYGVERLVEGADIVVRWALPYFYFLSRVGAHFVPKPVTTLASYSHCRALSQTSEASHHCFIHFSCDEKSQ